MERFNISVTNKKETLNFEVADYLYHQEDQCKFEIFKNGTMVASFEPDRNEHLRICKNPGNIPEEILHMVADKIGSMHL